MAILRRRLIDERMKTALSLAFLLLPSVLHAQQSAYGVTLGIVTNTAASEPHHITQDRSTVGFTSRTAYAVGLTALFCISDNFWIHSSFGYTGNSIHTTLLGPADHPLSTTLHFDYLRFSPKLQFRLFGGLIVGTGPVLDLNVKSSLDAIDEIENSPVTLSPIPGTREIRAGALFSTGYLMEFGTRLVVLPEVTYDLGLSNTNDYYGGKYSSAQFSLSILLQ